MLKMKALLLSLILLLGLAACSEQKASQPAAPAVADNEQNRQAAAKQYLEAVPPRDLLSQMSEKVVKMLPEKSQKVFLEVMNSKDIQDATYRISLNGLVKHFTANELTAMTRFYGSPEGKSISKKFPAYMAEAMPEINKEVVAALQKAQKEQEAKEPQGQAKPGEPKAQTKPAEPQAPKAQPGKTGAPTPQPQTKPQGAK